MLDTSGRRLRPARPGRGSIVALLGPAFVASIAYVDPGNVAANLTSGARYGYLLVWVLVAANIMAMLVQYQSAKLGIVTGRTLPEILGARLRTGARRAYWVQAELVAVATDIAEVVGGAIALNLLFQLPLALSGILVGAVSMGLLLFQDRRGQRSFESIIIFLLAIIMVGFLAGLVVNPPDARGILSGLVPRFEGPDTVLLAASMLGATVMPHAIYVHSALARDRHHGNPDQARARRRGTGASTNGRDGNDGRTGALDRSTPSPSPQRLLRATRWDVITALGVAGVVNIGMLLLAAANLQGVSGTDSIAGAHAAVQANLGPFIAVVFAVGLLASGLASTSVGCYASVTIMAGLLRIRFSLLARRAVTLIPAVALLAFGVDPTWALVISQVVLSFGIPFALIPLVRLTSDATLMGAHRDRWPLRAAATVSVILVVALNIVLIALTIAGS